MTAGAAIRAHDLVAGYRKGRRHRPVVEVAALTAPAGQLTAVIGPNGGGKSTLLRTLVGTQPALHGTVFVDDVPLARLDRIERARRIAVVLTDRIEPGLLTVADVVLLGRHPHTDWRGHLTTDDYRAARSAAARLAVEHLWHQLFVELSDGQRQRVLVARALAQQPDVLVLDEPTAFLDVAGRIELTLAAAALARDGLAVIVATHDLELALSHADRVWLVADATVHASSPEQLVATGELTKAFSDDIVEVDTTTGTIRARLRGGQPIVVHGNDLDAQLVRRMVTRLGANVVDGPNGSAAWSIVWSADGWIVNTGPAVHLADGYDALAATLRALLRDERPGVPAVAVPSCTHPSVR